MNVMAEQHLVEAIQDALEPFVLRLRRLEALLEEEHAWSKAYR